MLSFSGASQLFHLCLPYNYDFGKSQPADGTVASYRASLAADRPLLGHTMRGRGGLSVALCPVATLCSPFTERTDGKQVILRSLPFLF